jgi:hypothetical protein
MEKDRTTTRCEAFTDDLLVDLEREIDAFFERAEQISRRELLHLLARKRRDIECRAHEFELEVDQDARDEERGRDDV